MPKLGPWVESAVGDLGLKLDARGLLPLAQARKRVRAAKVVARGETHVIEGQVSRPVDFDFLWAALLSLEDAGEFVREATRLQWKFSPRGFDNVAPFERYGAAIVPWLAHFVDAKGRLTSTPWCIVPCLHEISSKDALAVLLAIRDEASSERVRTWLRRHGTSALAALAREGNERAQQILARTKIPLSESIILEALDQAASSQIDFPLPWPGLRASVGHFELHAMRIVAARSKKGDDWGVLFEVVQGDLLEGPDDEFRWPATIQYYRYGSRVPIGGRYLEDGRKIGMYRVLPSGYRYQPFTKPKSFEGIEVVGPKGTKRLTLSDAFVDKHDLRPGKSCARIEDWPSVMAIRARLARDPDAFWIDPKALVKKELGLRDPVVIVATDRFEHTTKKPSASKTYRSLAEAIVKRDGKLFRPGRPNTSYRML